jgi:glycosyltransferase involved in cell wall biosynthesis
VALIALALFYPAILIVAIALSLPCIGSTVGGIPELIPSEDLIPPGDVTALVSKIREAELIPRKRPRDIIQAFAALNRPGVHLALAGPGESHIVQEMRQLASDLKVKNQVHFLGKRSDIPTLIKASIATILASEQEGLARCVLESLSIKITVIGTKIRGIQDILEDECGLLVKPGDIPGITQAMDWVLNHSEEVQTMGKKGRQKMENYQIDHIIKLHENLYAEALSHR